MSVQPKPDQIEQLLPMLSHVAEMVKKNGRLSRKTAQMLLLASDIEEDWALDELERWVKVLAEASVTTDPGEREMLQRALMWRGVPEAAAMLAIATVAGASDTQSVPLQQRLLASVERLDFGILAPGQQTTIEFEVQGGPGQIVVESDQVHVTPQSFGFGTTRVRVEAKPMQEGVLWSTLRLVTTGETLELTMIAQWVEVEPPAAMELSPSRLPNSVSPPTLEPTHPAPPKPAPSAPPIIHPTPGIVPQPRSRQSEPRVELAKLGLEMVRIPAGDFLYGDGNRRIHLDEFYISKTPVTNLQYQAFVDAAGFRKPDHWKDGKIPAGKKDHPVVNVSWYDAVAFCEWAGLRLPTEAEWEKAARGTDGRTYPWGEAKPDRRRCNFNNNVGDTTPVGNYPAGASPYGVLDMAGNVWEWVLPVINLNPPRLKIGEFRVLRGGSWSRNDDGVRSTYQYISNPHYWDSSIGFRCVRSS